MGSLREAKSRTAELAQMVQRLEGEIRITKGQSAELGAAAANTEQFGESTVMDAKDKLSELEAALEKAEADLALQLCEFRELRNLKLALAMEIVTFSELLEGAESRRGTGLQDSSAASVPWAGRENSCTEQSQSCESTRQSCTATFHSQRGLSYVPKVWNLDLEVPQDQHPEIPTGPAGLGLEQWNLSSRSSSSSHGKGVQEELWLMAVLGTKPHISHCMETQKGLFHAQDFCYFFWGIQ
ncbi:keratin, type II cytoskeletal 8-like [Corvus kubaryi]|uniref:keratin, type II cytoskeletal 8-like n=1 Tax=Corvus kubaryi TaxID=68294 RepID=UPI001C04EA11|nr:keratin, type II cytoskeletal 8-like [Corvus kubaryi]